MSFVSNDVDGRSYAWIYGASAEKLGWDMSGEGKM